MGQIPRSTERIFSYYYYYYVMRISRAAEAGIIASAAMGSRGIFFQGGAILGVWGTAVFSNWI